MSCVVITGAGERAFSAGYDVHEMADWSAEELRSSLERREPWIWHVAETPVPVIAALNGITYGVGAILATAVDMRDRLPEHQVPLHRRLPRRRQRDLEPPSPRGTRHGGGAADDLSGGRAGRRRRGSGCVNRVVDASGRWSTPRSRPPLSSPRNPGPGARAIKRLLRERDGRSLQEATRRREPRDAHGAGTEADLGALRRLSRRDQAEHLSASAGRPGSCPGGEPRERGTCRRPPSRPRGTRSRRGPAAGSGRGGAP